MTRKNQSNFWISILRKSEPDRRGAVVFQLVRLARLRWRRHRRRPWLAAVLSDDLTARRVKNEAMHETAVIITGDGEVDKPEMGMWAGGIEHDGTRRLMLTGRQFDDATVLAVAHAFEQQVDWEKR